MSLLFMARHSRFRLFEMSGNEDIGASTGSTEPLDPGRKYGWPDPSNKVNWTCSFCNKVCEGGVYRLKQHLVGGFRDETKCPTCPEHVREQVKLFMIKKAEAKNVTQMMPSVDDADDYDDVEELDPESLNTKGSGSGSVQSQKRSTVKGPLDMFVVDLYNFGLGSGQKNLSTHLFGPFFV